MPHAQICFRQIVSKNAELEALIRDTVRYLDLEFISKLSEERKQFGSKISPRQLSILKRSPDIGRLTDLAKGYGYAFIKFCDKIESHNENAVKTLIENSMQILDDVCGNKLDMQQKSCIVKELHNHLVVASAGTGKTTAIIGKVKYLLETGKCQSDEILVLSFTNATIDDISSKMDSEIGRMINVMNFHKLGFKIIRSSGTYPKKTEIKLDGFIKTQMAELSKNEVYAVRFLYYLRNNSSGKIPWFQFKDFPTYDAYIKANPPLTRQNEKVKSYGEKDIADFLNQNNIEYVY